MKIEFANTKEHAKIAKKLISEVGGIKKRFRVWLTLISFFSSFLIVLSLMIVIPTTMKVFSTYPAFIIGLVFMLFGIIIHFSGKQYLEKKINDKNGFHSAKISYEVLPGKLIILIDNGLKQEISPTEIQKFIDIKNYLLFFVRDYYAYYLPSIAFSNNDQRDEFKQKINEMIDFH